MADARRAPLKDQTDITGARALIVEARFYDDIQDALLEGAVAELKAAGVTHDLITVPGALEIPAAIAIALDAAEKNGKPYDAAIALGCVVRGDTIHFEIVSIESSRALMDLAVARGFPLGNGIITVNTDAQAWARARASELNKGGDAAARRGLPPCRRSTRWTSRVRGSTTSLPSSKATGSATRSKATNICRRRLRSSRTWWPAWCATRPGSIP
jgi:6,7-dimethyl-8-ribityllumazine synthase